MATSQREEGKKIALDYGKNVAAMIAATTEDDFEEQRGYLVSKVLQLAVDFSDIAGVAGGYYDKYGPLTK